MENKMRVIKSSQNDVFSEYLKIMSKFNKRRSLVKSATLVSSVIKGTLEAASVGADAAKALSKSVDDITKIYSSGGIKGLMDLPGFTAAATKFDSAGRPSVFLKALLGDVEYTNITTKIIQEATEGGAGGALKSLAKAEDQAAFLDDLLRFEKSGTYESAMNIANLYAKEGSFAEKAVARGKILDAIAPDNPGFKKQYFGEELNKTQMPNDLAKELGLGPKQLDEINEIVELKMLKKTEAPPPKTEAPGGQQKVEQPTGQQTTGKPSGPDSELKILPDDGGLYTKELKTTGFESQFDNVFDLGPDGNAIDLFIVSSNNKSYTQVAEEVTSAGSQAAKKMDELKQTGNLGDADIQEIVQLQRQIETDVKGLKSNVGEVDSRVATMISDSQVALEQSVKNASESLSKAQADALETIMREMAEQPGAVRAAMLDDMKKLTEAVEGVKAGKISEAQLKTLSDNFSARLKEAVKDLPTTKQMSDMIDAKLGKYQTDIEAAIAQGLKQIADQDPSAIAKIKKAVGEGGKASKFWTGLKWLAIGAGALYLGDAVIGFLSQMQGKPSTPLPPPNMMTPQNIKSNVVDFAELNKLSAYYQETITCLTSKEIYQPGTGADQLSKICLKAAQDALASYNTLKITPNASNLADFNSKNDLFIKEMARFGLYPNRSAELLGPNNPQDIQSCMGYQVTTTRIANDVANQISGLSTANQALQMSQQQQGGGGAQMQGTTINPQQFGNVPMQNVNNLYPIFGRQVIINMSGIQLQFSLAQFNMIPRKNLAQAALDYRSLLTSGRVLRELEISLNSTGKEFIADPDRFKVEGYMYDSPAFRSMPPNIRSLRDVEGAALGGSQNAYNVLGYAVARHIRNTLEAGGLNQYIGGLSRGKGQRRNQIRSPGYGYTGPRADELRRASEEKNKIIKESINNANNSDLKKFSDDFSKGYYKDAVKDLNSAEDSFLKEFYKSYGELSEYKPEAKKSESLYGLNEKDEDLILEAHPQTANIADSRGKGGLVENGHEQHKRMQEMFGDMPTANFKGSYAKLKKQMKKHGY